MEKIFIFLVTGLIANSIFAQTADFTVTAPYTSPTRNTCGEIDNCTSFASEDHIYQVTIPSNDTWTFSLCGLDNYDTRLGVGTTICSTDIDSNDDFCSLLSEITTTITAGTYFVTVEGFSGTDCGNYILDISSSVPPGADDVGVISIDAPQSACSLSANETVTVTVENFGTNSQSNIPVSYTVDFGSPVNETITNTISPGGTLSYTFTATADLSTLGSHSINAYTTLSGDGNNTNDATSTSVENVDLSTINMYVDRDSVCPGDEVAFAVYTQYPIDSYNWDFGDGATATSADASHTYTLTGNYPVSLSLTCGNDTTTLYDSVYVGNNVYPDPNDYNYFADPSMACPGDEIIFGVWASGRGTYLWDFGDGNTTTLTTVFNSGYDNFDIARHTYSNVGNYSVTLTLTNGCGNSFTDTIYVFIDTNLAVNGAYWWSNNSVNPCVGEPVLFYSTGGSTYVWDFGDGTPTVTTNITLTPVNHIYTSAGSYNGSVIITNSCGNAQTYTWDITVEAVCVTGIQEGKLSGNDPLLKVYPNPILNEATIAFELDKPSNVQLALYDIMGRRIELFKDKKESAGTHFQTINASDLNLTNGIYLVTLVVDREVYYSKVAIFR